MKKMTKQLILSMGVSAMAMGAFAEEEKVLNLYQWSDYMAEDTIANFEAATGIKVNLDMYDSNEVLEAKLFTGGTGYDVVVPTSEFFQRQIGAGIYQPLNKDLLPNLGNMDGELMAQAAAYDADNAHGVIYMWGTTGIGYNVGKVAEILGDDAPLDSWDLLFDPANVEKLASCGVTLLDAPTEVLAAALKYLGFDPDSNEEAELTQAGELVSSIQPHVRYFHSSQYIDDLAAGEVCLSMGWSGDVFLAQADAAEGTEIEYFIPSEGAQQWFDMMAIPADAPHPENAHAFINFIMDPQITADITNYVWYANANTPSMELVDDEVKEYEAIFPPQDVLDNLYTMKVKSAQESRLVNDLWAKVKAGE